MSRPSDPLDLSHLPAWVDEPCPFCGCPSDRFDGHVCEDYENERWRSSITNTINTLHSMRSSPGTPTDLSVRMLVIANALERGMDEIELYLGEAEKALQRLPEVSVTRFASPSEAELRARREYTERLAETQSKCARSALARVLQRCAKAMIELIILSRAR